MFRDLGCKALEIGVNSVSRMKEDSLMAVPKHLLKEFSWVSMHSPTNIYYDKSPESLQILDQIQAFHDYFPLNLVVIHPDRIKDPSVFESYTFPVGIENMDNRKESFQEPDSLAVLFNNHPSWQFVLDVNHCYTNDKTMVLAAELNSHFQNRLTEIQLSGYTELHDPLSQTKQIEIIKAIPEGSQPIIIESILVDVAQVREEYKYIVQSLNL